MTRVKRGTTSLKTRRTTLKAVKGYRFGRSKKERQANEAIAHAGTYAFAHRRDKKTAIRGLWQVHIGAFAKAQGLSYSKLIHALKTKNIKLNRKILSGLVGKHPDTMKRVFTTATK
ncbi:MAG: large subunit ribosomal protein L20 [Parcubacteria group bacterium Greene0416_14]|nr:MAG: large subunit ribosomal protein L20 [Parcubacteria group bacterium Greene0416_14]TSD00561.1 MAG: large subunit ribosomal protein L20 [Parcubacteria group bacterium Greene1014_15]TSD08254.1 MAG: large subunit ribosomal protein L20 [Parcubacteria group bacterium Greene0714_4]